MREKRGKTILRAEITTICFGNGVGEIVLVKEIDKDNTIYYYDGFDRWCYLREGEYKIVKDYRK